MNFKKINLFVATLFITVTLLSAHGKKDTEEIDVSNLHSWQETFDLEHRKAGKYNMFITASDLGGNTTVEGPFNLYVDPKSDLCISGITNPYPDMRVVGNLNIVGTCIDDDGVAFVDLILDEGMETEKRVRASGKEFWSYYLDTLNLPEGPHTIQVVGTDINGLQGIPTKMTWQLDRTQPVTSIQDKVMGVLVSGNVKFQGYVTDGNGIKELFSSVDNGQTFQPVKISRTKDNAVVSFTVGVDTKKFADGPSVIWFKATDNAGSTGLYSFLYYIDNTKPDVAIVAPAQDEVVNGKFTVAGYAKDTVGVTQLSWSFENQKGDIELIPGNPYWAVQLDTIGAGSGTKKFTIHAVDKAGNIVEVTKPIVINQELDKPVVTISAPTPGEKKSFSGLDEIFILGTAHDDDGVAKVKIQLDNQEPVEQETRADFYAKLCTAGELSNGAHKITVTATDIYGVEGHPVVSEFIIMGDQPDFTNMKVTGKAAGEYVDGMEIHPEGGNAISVTANSPVGLKTIHTELAYGKDQIIANDIEVKGNSYTVNLPVTPDSPRGVMRYSIAATDTLDRVSTYRTIFYVTNTTLVKNEGPVLIFDDSTIDENGEVTCNMEFPLTGYLLGAKASSVDIYPATPFARAELHGNQVKVISLGATGRSAKVVVRVRTDKGKIVESRPLIFKSDTEIPSITINNYSENQAVDAREENLSVSGKVTCKTGIGNLTYRILSAKTEIKGGVIGTVKTEVENDFQTIKPDSSGNFNIKISTPEMPAGIYVLEVVAESAGGNKNAKGICFSTIPEIEEINGKIPAAKNPVVSWLDGYNVYAVAAYQGVMDANFKEYSRNEMMEGANQLTFEATPEGKAVVLSKYTANKNPTLSAVFAKINDEPFVNGMPITLAYASKDAATLTMFIDTGATVGSVNYEITGDDVAGGDIRQTGSAKITKPEEGSQRWTAEIPLSNLPSRINKIKATVKAGSLEQAVTGSVAVIREVTSEIDDKERIYSFAGPGTEYSASEGGYLLKDGSKFYFYANVMGPIKAEVLNAADGLQIETVGKFIVLTPVRDGTYTNIGVRVTDISGDVYTSDRFTFVADSKPSELVIQTPELHKWVKKVFTLSGTVADDVGVRTVEYSLDNGTTWKELTKYGYTKTGGKGITFSEDISIADKEEGLIGITVRSIDASGHVTYARTAVTKDTIAPAITVIEPLETDVINGENLLVFKVDEYNYIASGEYVAPPRRGSRSPLELTPLVTCLVGTPERPVDDAMSFVFKDAAGNTGTMEAWKFSIDNKSDLPVAEIHLPEENQVITRDFTISGVIYDDDGESSIYYKIDNGAFQKLPQMGTSYSIDVPLSTMTDNEHTITVYAVDINGVKGEEVSRKIRISLEEPKGSVEKPTIDTSVRERVTISGVASDKNGIEKVQVSLDNGNSYNDAVGTENWTYTVDTRAIPGGTQVVFLKVTDKYGIQGLYSSLINIDNNAPEISLELPLDDSSTTGDLFFSGYTYDNVEVTDLYVTIRNLEKGSAPDVRKLKIERIIGETLDIRNLPDGFYNIELTGKDKAGNSTNVSRNIHLQKNSAAAVVDLLYPLNGEHKQGVFNIYGQAKAETKIESLKLYIDNKFIEETQITDTGFFRFDMSPEKIAAGVHKYRVDAVLSAGKSIPSKEQTITYNPAGPWVTVENFTYGDFAINRPYLKGQAGYSIDEDELLFSKTKEATPEQKQAVANKKVAKIELSFDNGKTFKTISTNEKWMYRIENQDIAEGYHFLLLRATMKNGETAINRVIVQVDNTKPTIRLIGPSTGGRYNQKLEASGLSNDDVRLENVKVTLRKGDKSSYEVPSFIQGLYLDFHFWGSTLFEIGAGLTFFDDNVKLQFQWGQFTQEQRDAISTLLGLELTDLRYGGNVVLGAKLLANIANIPFSFFLGHDWEWLYASFAVGAQFSMFNQTNSGKPQILSAVLIQQEFPKVKIPNVKVFSTLSMYSEFSLWFIPTDVSGTVDIQSFVPQFAIGLRANVF